MGQALRATVRNSSFTAALAALFMAVTLLPVNSAAAEETEGVVLSRRLAAAIQAGDIAEVKTVLDLKPDFANLRV